MHSIINHIVLIMAMRSEAEPVIEQLQLVEKKNGLDASPPFILYQNTQSAQKISLIVSGQDPRYGVDNIGTLAATLMAYTATTELKPDLIISAGTAGGFACKGAGIGTVYLSDEKFIFHDRIVPLAGFDQSAVGNYPAQNVRKMAQDLQLPCGIISSGSSLKKTAEDIQSIEQNNAVAKEMEAAAVAWVCWLKGQPMMAVKSITNLLDTEGESEQQFLKNLSFASERLSKTLMDILHYLQNKTVADLGL